MVVFNYVDKITKDDLFIYLVIGVGSLVFTTMIVNTNIRNIAGIVLGLAIVFFLQDKKISTIETTNQNLEFKLSSIKRLTQEIDGITKNTDFLHIDADLINLFYNLQDFEKYNTEAYRHMVKSSNNILKLEEDLRKGVLNCQENYEEAMKFRDHAMNHYHSFIYSLPSNEFVDNKFQNNQKRLQLLLRRHLDDMYRLCKKQYRKTGYNMFRKPLTNNGPRKNDINSIHFSNFDLFV